MTTRSPFPALLLALAGLAAALSACEKTYTPERAALYDHSEDICRRNPDKCRADHYQGGTF